MKCRWLDCGFCYCPVLNDCHVQTGTNKCLGYNICEQYQKDGKMDEPKPMPGYDAIALAKMAKEHGITVKEMVERIEASEPNIEVLDAHGASVVIERTEDKHTERKQRPVYSGVLKYFPDALMEVAHCSWLGNEQHNPGEPLHWNREKSADELDALVRHLMKIDEMDDDGVLHAVKVAWRSLAYLQKLLEKNEEA
jgi:hypothetical protein